MFTISDFKAKRKSSLAIIQAYVHCELNDGTFLIGDATGHAMLSLYANPQFGTNISEGRCIKLLNPHFDVTKGVFTLMNNATAIKCSPITYKPLEEDVLAGISLDCHEIIKNLPPKSTLPTMIAKVIFVSHVRTSKDGAHRYCTIALKDLRGNRVAADVSDNNLEKVDWDCVYSFHNLKVATHKGEKRLVAEETSKISEVGEEVAGLFPPRGGEDTDDGELKGINFLLAPYEDDVA